MCYLLLVLFTYFKMENYKCCFCKGKFEDYGNNPTPIKHKGRCCNKCNWQIVIPARLKLLGDTFIVSDGNLKVIELIPLMMEDERYRKKLRKLVLDFMMNGKKI